MVSTPEGERIYTLKGADEPYRILFEQMNEGAVTTSEEGLILYCNHSFADLMKVPLETVIGAPVRRVPGALATGSAPQDNRTERKRSGQGRADVQGERRHPGSRRSCR